MAADSDRGQQLLRDFDIDAAQLPAAIHAGGRVLYDPPPADLAASHGIATRPSQPIYDLAVLGAGPAGLAAGQLSVQPHPSSFLPTVVPPDVERMCLTYQALSGLAFIGFDFKVTDAGEHVLLEANPMPGYDVFDRRLGYRISQALLDLLTTARSTGRGDQ